MSVLNLAWFLQKCNKNNDWPCKFFFKIASLELCKQSTRFIFPSSFLEAVWSYLSWCTPLSNIKHSGQNRLIQSMFLIVSYYKENENKNIHGEFLNLGDQIGRKSKCFILVHQGISYQVVDSLREKISLNLEKKLKNPQYFINTKS